MIKLCVGCDTVEDLLDWHSAEIGAGGPWLMRTRQTPKRAAEMVDGGSLYRVIKGNVQCRQRLLEIRPFTDGEGISRCHLVLDPAVVRTDWQPRRAFQGWRYLKPADAPDDLTEGRAGWMALPVELRSELATLGLL